MNDMQEKKKRSRSCRGSRSSDALRCCPEVSGQLRERGKKQPGAVEDIRSSGRVDMLERSALLHRRRGEFGEAIADLRLARSKGQAEVFEEAVDFEALQSDEPGDVTPRRKEALIRRWVSVLRQTRYFEDLQDREMASRAHSMDETHGSPLEEVAKTVRALEFQPGETIFKEGDHGDEFYVVYRGFVNIQKETKNKRTSLQDKKQDVALAEKTRQQRGKVDDDDDKRKKKGGGAEGTSSSSSSESTFLSKKKKKKTKEMAPIIMSPLERRLVENEDLSKAWSSLRAMGGQKVLQAVDSSATVLVRLGPGSGFGEGAIDEGSKRGADAVASTKCVLLMLKGKHYKVITQQLKKIEYEDRERWLRHCAAFDNFRPEEIRVLARRMQVKLWRGGKDSIVLKEGDEVPELYVIKAGVIDLFKALPEASCNNTANIIMPKKQQKAFPEKPFFFVNNTPKNVNDEALSFCPEEPGEWVLQSNWRDADKGLLPLSDKRRTNNSRQMLVGVLGRGQVFGEMAALNPGARSPVTAVALTNVILYTISSQVIDELQLMFHVPLVNFLDASLMLHNPPIAKLAEMHRNRESWQKAKDGVLATVMSKRWIGARRRAMKKE